MNSSDLLCKIHNKRIHSFCSAEKCENIMLCISCIFNHNKEHETKVIESLDFNESFLISKIETIFETMKNEDDENYKIYESLIEQIERIESICISHLKEIKQAIQNTMGLINFDIRKSIVNEIRENYKDFSQKENISKEKDLKKIFAKIHDCDNNVKNINNKKYYEQKHSAIMEEFSNLKNCFKEKKSMILSLLKEEIPLFETMMFDKNFIQADIELSEDGLEARKLNGNAQKALLFDKCFSQGIHRWSLQLEGLNESDGNLIQFGVLDKTDFNNSNDVNVYNSMFNNENSWSIGSQNYFKNCIKKMILTGACASYKNLKFDCILHCDDGIFIIVGNGIKAEAKGLKKKSLYPFISLYNNGGCVKIILKE